MGKLNGILVAEILSDLDYFKYTSPEDIEAVKTEIIEGFDDDRILCTANLKESPYTPLCYRLYGCDGEDLFEMGGITELLEDIHPTFKKFNIPLSWKDDFISDDLLEHTIVINDKKYYAFKGDPNKMNAWAWATRNFIEIINDQLSLNNSNERLLPIMSGNEGNMVFLTEEQYKYIRTHFDKKEGPMQLDIWWESAI
jgi:hypothetical protein